MVPMDRVSATINGALKVATQGPLLGCGCVLTQFVGFMGLREGRHRRHWKEEDNGDEENAFVHWDFSHLLITVS
jgi:hypothetical protein